MANGYSDERNQRLIERYLFPAAGVLAVLLGILAAVALSGVLEKR